MVERAARGSCKDSDEEEKVEVAVNVIFEIFHAVFSLLEMNSSDKAETYLLVAQESPSMVQVPTQSLNPRKGILREGSKSSSLYIFDAVGEKWGSGVRRPVSGANKPTL